MSKVDRKDHTRTHVDDGCSVASQCISCPLATCKYDDPQGYYTHLHLEEAYNVIGGLTSLPQGKAKQLAQDFGINERTVYRMLRRLKGLAT